MSFERNITKSQVDTFTVDLASSGSSDQIDFGQAVKEIHLLSNDLPIKYRLGTTTADQDDFYLAGEDVLKIKNVNVSSINVISDADNSTNSTTVHVIAFEYT